MAKRVNLTERIKSLLSARGVDDFSKVAVYECIAASTRPINQRGSIYNGARMTPEMLKGFTTYLQQESVPLQLMHDSYALPKGQLLEAGTYTEGFDTELNALFYLEDGSDEANKMDLGIIDEVSVGALSQKACCSKCGFDYFENDKRKMQLVWDRTCDNEHVIGEDGCHLILDGLSKWQELSLVPKGASSKPKILPVDKQRLANDESYRQLAASGFNPDQLTLHASTRLPHESSTQDDEMETEKLIAQLTQQSLQLGEANAAKSQVDAQLLAANTRITELETALTAAKTEPGEREVSLQASLDAANSELVDVKTSNSQMAAFLSESYKKAQAVLGQEVKEDASVEDMMAAVGDARLALHQIPVGGASESADQGDEQSNEAPVMHFSATAFSTR